MKNPCSGYCIGIEKGRVPSDENGLKHKWVTDDWSYFGNSRDEPMEHSCGPPVLDEELPLALSRHC